MDMFLFYARTGNKTILVKSNITSGLVPSNFFEFVLKFWSS